MSYSVTNIHIFLSILLLQSRTPWTATRKWNWRTWLCEVGYSPLSSGRLPHLLLLPLERYLHFWKSKCHVHIIPKGWRLCFTPNASVSFLLLRSASSSLSFTLDILSKAITWRSEKGELISRNRLWLCSGLKNFRTLYIILIGWQSRWSKKRSEEDVLTDTGCNRAMIRRKTVWDTLCVAHDYLLMGYNDFLYGFKREKE